MSEPEEGFIDETLNVKIDDEVIVQEHIEEKVIETTKQEQDSKINEELEKIQEQINKEEEEELTKEEVLKESSEECNSQDNEFSTTSESEEESETKYLKKEDLLKLSSEIESLFKIKVKEPQEEGGRFKKHTTYLIKTKTKHSGYEKQYYEVRRRYSEFLWLRNSSILMYPGTIIPSIPEKSALNKMNPDFIRKRMIGLNNFLQKYSIHKRLCSSPLLKKFLTVEKSIGDSTLKVKKSKEGVYLNLPYSQLNKVEDLRVENENEKWNKLSNPLLNFHKSTEKYLNAMKSVGESIQEMGEQMDLVHNAWYGDEEGDKFGQTLLNFTCDIRSLGEIIVKSTDNHEPVIEQFAGMSRQCKSVQDAYKSRMKTRKCLINSSQKLDKLRSNVQKIQGTGKRQIKSARKATKIQKDIVEELELQDNTIGAVLASELSNASWEFVQDLSKSVEQFVLLQKELSKRTVELWAQEDII